MNKTSRHLAILASLLCTFASAQTYAQQKKPLLPDGYPARPIRVIVSTAPGGGLDIITRAVGTKFGERTGANIVVDNQGGASGGIAINTVASAAPDGYTLLSAGGTLLINAVFGRFERDVRTALVPLVRMSTSHYFLIVPSAFPANTFKEFLAHARANPGKLNYGSNGVGSVIHLGLELIELGANLDMIHVPYKGNAQVYLDLVAGRLNVALASVSGIQSVRAGKAKILATTRPQRVPEFPDVPTIAESGIPGYDVANTYMLYAHAQMPATILNALNRELVQVIAAPDIKEKMAADGAVPAPPLTPAELKTAYVADYAKWEGVIRKAGVKPED